MHKRRKALCAKRREKRRAKRREKRREKRRAVAEAKESRERGDRLWVLHLVHQRTDLEMIVHRRQEAVDERWMYSARLALEQSGGDAGVAANFLANKSCAWRGQAHAQYITCNKVQEEAV